MLVARSRHLLLQETSLHCYYKAIERDWEKHNATWFGKEDVDKLSRAYYLVSIAIIARIVHAWRYYRDDYCEGHEKRVIWLYSDRRNIENLIHDGNRGLLLEENAEKKIQENLVDALERVNEDLPDWEFHTLLRDFPEVQIVPEDTLGAITRASRRAEILASNKAYNPIDWSGDEPMSEADREKWAIYYETQVQW
ncbi:uncharacterized protein F4812DRAFT_466009 [Daldinia caldariorum]|uniref:uncharacterized protein n=1 Tax=Daldinia caldariorum TaxID=326644 RepID=UPI002008B0A3|nr:uncharacterized protein F4812DRAFT_466009 [Daldinia caldariorum]KAI1466201.1 hypothetical protein F4812DRAFT_466009 [Daldinia caldariorum]